MEMKEIINHFYQERDGEGGKKEIALLERRMGRELKERMREDKNLKDAINSKLEGIKGKMERKEHFSRLALEFFCKKPYHYHFIPQVLAERLVPDANQEIKTTGELLRKAWAAGLDRTFSRNGLGKINYTRDVGFVNGTKFPYTTLLDEFSIVEFPAQDGYLYFPLDRLLREQTVSRFMKKCVPLPRKKLSISLVKSVMKEIGYKGEEGAPVIYEVLNSPVGVISGGAGTGKTGIIEAIVRINDRYGILSVVLSFTGRAVANLKSRIKESSSVIFSTIHSFMYKIKDSKEGSFPDEPFTLIIEECSMVSTSLISKLFKKISEECDVQLILVGDKDQLPPIEWGMFFLSVIESGFYKEHTLKINHRSNKEITSDASHFKQGAHLPDMKHIPKTRYCENLEKFYRSCAHDTHMIVTPISKMRKSINEEIQKLLNKGKETIINHFSHTYYLSDKVIFNKNLASTNVYNGTIGRIVGKIYKAMEKCICGKSLLEGESEEESEEESEDENSNQAKSIDTCTNTCMDGYLLLYHGGRWENFYSNPGGKVLHLLVDICNEERIAVPAMRRVKKEENLDEEESIEENEKQVYPTLENLELAYCLTTHKAQGGEWKNVLYYLNNWLPCYIPGGTANVYTALTRAKDELLVYRPKEGRLNHIHRTHDMLPILLNMK